MKRVPMILTVAYALTACASAPAPGAAQNDLGRLHVYEVAPEQAAQAQEAGFLEVTGTGTVQVAADRAQIAFAVETRANAAGDASAANADLMDAVHRSLRDAGLPGMTIETFGYSLRPDYSFSNADGRRTRLIDGYTATNNVRVTIDDVGAVGRLIDVAIQAGANRVSSLSFMASDTESARGKALSEAVERARSEATAIARALGYELGAPLEVRGGAQTPRPRPIAGGAIRAMEAAPTPVEAGDQAVRATVTIRFALGPELPGR